MATVADVQAAIKARIAANYTATPVRYHNEDNTLPDTPEPYVFVELDLDPPFNVAFGGGRLQNRHRTTGEILAHVMVPAGQGVDGGYAYGEQIAALFRNYRDSTMSCFAAEPLPGTGTVENGQYAAVCMVVVDIFFDKIG